MVDVRLDDAVADRLGHYELGVDGRVELQALRDRLQRDLRVRQAHHLDARLDHVVPQADDQRPRVLLDELVAVLLEHLAELGQVAGAHRLRQLKVGVQGLAHGRRAKRRLVGYLAEQELDDDGELLHDLLEADGLVLRRLAQRLHQVLVRLGVLELDGFDAAGVEEVASPLVVGRLRRKCRLGDQLERLVVQVVLKIAAQERVDQHRCALVVVAQDGRAESRVQETVRCEVKKKKNNTKKLIIFRSC